VGPSAVIFDLDGTLLDTLPDLADSLNSALANKGLAVRDYEEVRLMIGSGVTKLIERALAPADSGVFGRPQPEPGLVEAVRADFKAQYKLRQLEKTRPYQGIGLVLDKLGQMRIPLAVLSNKDHENSLAIIGHFFPGRFKVVQGAEPSLPLKPDPAGALKTLAALGAEKERALYLGDSAVDIFAAKNAALTPLGAAWGFRPKEELMEAGAFKIFSEPMELLGFIEGLK
jgi:phosphoglycolate phosphatase